MHAMTLPPKTYRVNKAWTRLEQEHGELRWDAVVKALFAAKSYYVYFRWWKRPVRDLIGMLHKIIVTTGKELLDETGFLTIDNICFVVSTAMHTHGLDWRLLPALDGTGGVTMKLPQTLNSKYKWAKHAPSSPQVFEATRQRGLTTRSLKRAACVLVDPHDRLKARR